MGASASKHKTHGSKRDVNRIPDRPSPPGKPQLVPGTSHSEPDVVTIRWDPPEYDGGAKVTGYLVEHRRTGSPHWVRASPTLVRLPELTLSGLEPGWRYQFRVSAKNANGMSEPGELSELLTVTLQRTAASAPHFTKELSDTVALENEKAELTVELRGTPTPTVAWYKDGLEIFSGRRHRIITENNTSTLIIHQTALSDEGEIKCTATNRVGHAVTKATLKMEAPPSIRLPRQYEEGLLFEKDEVVRLKVTIAGRPVPSVSWLHNGEPLTNSGRYEMAYTDRHATLRMDEARRSDRGEYQVRAINKLGEDVASFLVTVTDRPQSPGKAKVVMTLGRSVTLSWTAPEDDGGCKIGNYIVEYYRLGWNMWLKAATCRQLTTQLGDLIEGSEYKFRVKAENPYGVSDPGEESDILFIPDPHRGLLTPPERRERGGSEETDIEEWLLDPHKRQRETTPGGSPSREHKKVKKKQEPQMIRRKSQEKQLFPKNTLMHEDNGYLPEQKSTEYNTDLNKELKDAPVVPKRRAKRKQELKSNDENEEIKQKIEITDKGKTEENQQKRAKTEDLHSSSELMLVLLPQSRATTEERESTKKEIIDSLKDESAGIAPPISISAPELGSIEPERTMNRLWVSSTELLHERALARFYQEVAEEEAEKALQRRYSFERRSSSRSREISQFIRNKSITGSDEMLKEKISKHLLLPDEKQYSKFETDEKDNQTSDEFNKIEYTQDLKEDDENFQLKAKKELLQPQNSEEEEEEESKITQDEVEESISEESDIEDDEYMGETEGYEIEEEEEEDDEEEMEEEEEVEEEEEEIEDDDIDMLGESEEEYDERPPYNTEEETYHPRSMTPRTGKFTSASPSSSSSITKTNTIVDNLQSVTDVATAIVSHSIKVPIKSNTMLKPPEIPRSMVRIEVTPPPGDDLTSIKEKICTKQEELGETKKHIVKPIIKKSASPNREYSPTNVHFKSEKEEKITNVTTATTNKYSPPRFTPDGRHLPNLNAPIPKPILKIRDHSQERSITDDKKNNSNNLKINTAPLAEVESELNIITKNEPTETKINSDNNVTDNTKLKKKQVRIEEPENKKLYDIDESDIGITTAGDIARNRRRSPRSSFVDSSDPTKCLIHHYSDIVREFGRVRKVPTTLYLNYDDLKAAAQKSEDNLYDPLLANTEESLPEKEKLDEEENYMEKEKDDETNKYNNNKNNQNEQEKEENRTIFDDDEPELEFLMESAEIKELPKLILLKDVFLKEGQQEPIKEEEQQVKEEEEEEKIIRDVIVYENNLTKIAEKKVRSFFDYLTDVAMFFIACWLYAFNDERLAIPILIIMIYRQAKEATVSYVKRKIANLPKLPRLPWRKRQ
ncbi:myomesin and myosin binding protein [Lycorma delicatula]|uniref:myomesin and myosin binding protein n=1 Tax=Lycorma delicatula TaxID=130591 RepID=UPI003F518FD2